MKEVLGIDIGGTGTKGAIVDIERGIFVTEKIKYATPKPSTPNRVIEVVQQLIKDFNWQGKDFGCGFPAIIKDNTCYSAANIDDGWLGVNLQEFFKNHTGSHVTFTNDADAAAVAEMTYGRGKGRMGTVILLTLGTGIGSGIFINGSLFPNTEFGHLLYKKSVFEHYASNGARKKKELSWKQWGKELNTYLNHVHFLISPDLIILGGGVSKHFDKYGDYLEVPTELVAAAMGNDAGIIGAAMMSLKDTLQRS
ncbi:MAG: ROK family protein [Flavobacteriaceae bacterium]|nr:ROK family protein [Flavobacteriaceae bacterium]